MKTHSFWLALVASPAFLLAQGLFKSDRATYGMPENTVATSDAGECGPERTRCVQPNAQEPDCPAATWCCSLDELCVYDGSCFGGCHVTP